MARLKQKQEFYAAVGANGTRHDSFDNGTLKSFWENGTIGGRFKGINPKQPGSLLGAPTQSGGTITIGLTPPSSGIGIPQPSPGDPFGLKTPPTDPWGQPASANPFGLPTTGERDQFGRPKIDWKKLPKDDGVPANY